MWIFLKPEDEWAVGDEMLDLVSGTWTRLRDEKDIAVFRAVKPLGVPVRRRLTGWEAVEHALKTEVLGNDKEGCETTSLFWDCECDTDYLHTRIFGKCLRCGADRDRQPDARKAEVIMKIIGEE